MLTDNHWFKNKNRMINSIVFKHCRTTKGPFKTLRSFFYSLKQSKQDKKCFKNPGGALFPATITATANVCVCVFWLYCVSRRRVSHGCLCLFHLCAPDRFPCLWCFCNTSWRRARTACLASGPEARSRNSAWPPPTPAYSSRSTSEPTRGR